MRDFIWVNHTYYQVIGDLNGGVITHIDAQVVFDDVGEPVSIESVDLYVVGSKTRRL
jgi:hypothetical protein